MMGSAQHINTGLHNIEVFQFRVPAAFCSAQADLMLRGIGPLIMTGCFAGNHSLIYRNSAVSIFVVLKADDQLGFDQRDTRRLFAGQ
jgi:hypothetical protein